MRRTIIGDLMALLHCEGFEGFDAGNGSQPQGWTAVYAVDTSSGFQIENGRHSGSKAIECQTNIETSRFFSLAVGNLATLVVGMAIYIPSPGPANDRMLLAFREGASLGMNVRLLTSGEYQVRLGTSALATTSGEARLDAWHYIEFKVVTHGSSGSYELRIGGSTVLSDSGIDTMIGSNAWHDTVRFHSASSLMLIDDIYIDDSTLHGDHRVVTLLPDAAGDDADFTPSSGNNYQAVDESAHNSDSDYVESSTTDHQDLHGVPAPSDIGTIVGIQHVVIARKTDVTNFDIKLVTKSGSTESVDSAQTVDSSSYTAKRRILEDDPDTSAAWADASAVGAAQFGYRVG